MEWIIVFAIALLWDTWTTEDNYIQAKIEEKKELERLGVYD